jgi:hypothetical protein
MAPSDTNNDYKVRSFPHLHSGFGYNLFGSTYTCNYLIVGSNVFHNGSSSKLNFRFVGSPTMPHWEGHNSSIRSAIEVNEHLMESLFDKLSNRSGPISISRRQGLQITNIFYRYFWRELHCRYGLVRHPWDPGPSWSMPQEDGEHLRDGLGHPPPWPPSLEAIKDVQAKPEAQFNPSSSLPRPSGPVCNKMDAHDASEFCFR